MRRHRLWLSTIFFFVSFGVLRGAAVAQALPTATGPGAAIVIGVGTSIYHLDYGERDLGGTEAWVDYNPFLHVGIEGEARTLDYNEDLGTHATTLLVGPRVVLHRGNLEPYVKTLAGTGHFVFPYNYARGNYLVVSGGAGLNLHVGSRLQVRMIDISYQYWPKFTFGTLSMYGISAGVSYTVRTGTTWWTR